MKHWKHIFLQAKKKTTATFLFFCILFLTSCSTDDVIDFLEQAGTATESTSSGQAETPEIPDASEQTETPEISDSSEQAETSTRRSYTFRKPSYLKDHFKKHGQEMGAESEEEYLQMANDVIHNPDAITKLEAEDDDQIFFLDDTNEIVFLSQDGYIRTYFICSGINYFNRQ